MLDHRGILISDDIVAEPDSVRAILARRVHEFLGQTTSTDRSVHVVRLVVPVLPLDRYAWLAAQSLFPRIYWHGRADEMAVAAVGTAHRCFGGPSADYDDLRRQLDVILPESDARVRYFGGFRFDHTSEREAEWEPFGTFAFTLPRFELLTRGDRALLACNLLLPRDVSRKAEILEEIEALQFPLTEQPTDLPVPISREDAPDRSGWENNIRAALDAFRSGVLHKVVLARRARFGFAESVDPLTLLKRLEGTTENCFHFGFQFDDGVAFLGATPERLFRRNERKIWTEAVAGTRPRGATPEEDAAYLQSLLDSEKDQREHAYVRESIAQSLTPLCEAFHIDDRAAEMKLASGWHLVSRSHGTLQPGIHGSDVMRALHPTPAVGGYPTEAALETIRSLEPFDRGWYTGPVGWIGSQGAEFAVALRCGLVQDNVLSLYSGAGIVEGSDSESEWEEIEQKIGDFVKVLGLDLRYGT